MHVYLLLFLFITGTTLADEEPIRPEQEVGEVHPDALPSVVNITSLPSAVVNGCVNVISGDYYEYEQDDVVSGGSAPYVLGHSYASTSLEEGNLSAGWNFLHHHLLEVYQPGRIEYVRKDAFKTTPYLYPFEMTELYKACTGKKLLFPHEIQKSSIDPEEHPLFAKPIDFLQNNIVEKSSSTAIDDPIFLSLYDPSGGRLLYVTSYDEYNSKRPLHHFKLQMKNSAITNVMHGTISGQTNVKNIKIQWDKKKDRFHVGFGDGTWRIYDRQWKYKKMKKKRPHHAKYYRDYQLHKEFLPNGNRRTYYYNKHHHVTAVKTYNKDISHKLSWVWFDQKSPKEFSQNPTLLVKTSDGHSHTYHFEKLKGKKLDGQYAVSSINRLGLPKVSFQYGEADKKGKRRLIKKTSADGYYIKNTYDEKGRVIEQSSPIGPNGEEVTTHKYYYHEWKDGSGKCSVRDACDNLTRYYWNADKRLVGITRLTPQKKQLMHEQFYWAKNHSDNKGNLRAHVVKDENNEIRLVRKYKYDDFGNIKKETLLAHITKNEGKIIFRDDLTHDETSDKIVTWYEYSNDGFNLKTSECDPHDNYTYYKYYPGSNLLAATFICDKKAIRKREFFTYDANATLIEHIVDDGSSTNKDCLDSVTERHKKEIKPRLNRPHFGEAEQIEDSYYDFEKAAFIPFKKEVNQFDERGRVIKKEIIDSAEDAVTYHYIYDEADRLIQTIDPQGNTETHTYDPITHRLIEKKGLRDDVRWHYSYDAKGNVVKETERHRDGLELVTQFEYDLLGRKVAVVDPQGNTTRYTYDHLHRITSITYPDIFDHKGTKITPQKTYSYKNLGSIITETNELGEITRTSYNAIGKITKIELPDGSSKAYLYDVKGNVVEEVAPNKTSTYLSYDCFNRVIKTSQLSSVRSIDYSTFHEIMEKGPTGEKIRYSYNNAGKLISKEQNGRKTTYTYDKKMRLKKERTALEDGFVAKSFRYDSLNRIVHEKLYDHTSPLRSYKSYGYDQEGNITTYTQNIANNEAITRRLFRPGGLLDVETDALGHETLHKYSYFHKNDHGQTVFCKITIDPQGCSQEETFDTSGNLSLICRYDPMHTLIAKKSLYYDAGHNCIRIEENTISQSGEKSIVTLFSYKNQHLTKIVEAAGTPEEKITRYRYNKNGELETIIHADGTCLNHQYDGKGRLTHFYSNDYSIDYTYTYDASDRVIEVHNGSTNSKTLRSYNTFGELISETLETGITLSYDYDKAGRIATLTLPDNSTVAYSHSAYLDSVTRNDYTYKVAGRDLSGFMTYAQLPGNAGSLTTSHDLLGRNTTISHSHFEQKSEEFDSVGNLLHLHTIEPHRKSSRSFTYDYLSQLIEEKGPTTHSYSYDSLYNRLEHNGTSYEVNSLHSVLNNSLNSFSYDARGNRIKMKSSNGAIEYKYDPLDRLTEVSTPEGHFSYTYDPFNRRLSKNNVRYIYAQDNEIGAMDENNAITELRILGEGLGAEIGASVLLECNNTTYVPIHDRQGNIALLLDLQGNPIQTYTYDAFGNESTMDPISPWRFSSKRFDPETGLIYFGRRYYDPALGKWLTQDPLGLNAGPNLYAYVLNNPLNSFDEYGLYVEFERERAEIHYTATHGILGAKEYDIRSRDTREGRTEYSFVYSYDHPYTISIPEDESDDEDTFNKYAAYALDSAEIALTAADVGGMALLACGTPNAKVAGLGSKALSWLGKQITKRLRSCITHTSHQTSHITRAYNIAIRGNRPTTDFVWGKVEINGKFVEGWSDVGATLRRIQNGTKHSHIKDGTIHHNAEKLLPMKPSGYYREHVVNTHGVNHAGRQRIITGQNGECYYTSDHYKTFTPLN